jgi:hypothetical protein
MSDTEAGALRFFADPAAVGPACESATCECRSGSWRSVHCIRRRAVRARRAVAPDQVIKLHVYRVSESPDGTQSVVDYWEETTVGQLLADCDGPRPNAGRKR